MLLFVTGLFLLALGLFSGGVLVAVPLGLVPWTAGPVLWVLFPLFCVVGYVLFVIGGRSAQVRGGSLLVSALLLLLALASAVALVLQAAAVVQPQGSTLSLWYVLAIAGLVGVVGAASLGRMPEQATG
jgi:hypothetical protein